MTEAEPVLIILSALAPLFILRLEKEGDLCYANNGILFEERTRFYNAALKAQNESKMRKNGSAE